jgi:class 3 adenylate cyclase
MSASLVITTGPLAGQRFPFDAQVIVGRADADVTIDDPLISRRHAVVRLAEDALEIEDLGSLNGTWVNGIGIDSPRRLDAADIVQVGSVSFQVEDHRPTGAHTTLAPATAPAVSPARPRSRDQAAQEPQPATHGEDELRPVTALFADIVGSTTLGERLTPDAVKLVIGDFVGRMTRAVEQYGGTVQAYMGDGIAAFFGVARAHEDDAERAARAGLAILAEAAAYAREVESSWQISNFGVRVGINTGPVAIGFVGGASPQAVTVGDTPNVAARLQSLADPGSIVVGDATAKSLARMFALEPLGEVAVKGRREPVRAWRLVATQAILQSRPSTPLVGRDSEMARLQGILDELGEGRGQIGVLLGDAGIGKSRLIAEHHNRAAASVTWLEGQCLSYGTDVTYGPFIQILKNWIGAEEGEGNLSVMTKLRAALAQLPASEIADVLPYLARVLSLRLDAADEQTLARQSPADLARKLHLAYRAWLLSLAERGPVVAVIEDLHWADPQSCQLLEELLELVDRAPLLFVLTLRIESASAGWQVRMKALSDHPRRTTEFPLGPLNRDDSRRLLQGVSRSAELAAPDLELIAAAAEGNPLYLEELLNAVLDSATALTDHPWGQSVIRPRMLTPTLESLLLARIDTLSESGRRLAQLAAVIGRTFPVKVLEHIADVEDVDQVLTSIVRADIIRELRRYPDLEYSFRHGLLWQACLSTLPEARRRRLHGSVATAFESLFRDTLDNHLEIIAHHFARSDNLRKALVYLERAGARAAALDASQRAEELWTKALRVADDLGDAEATQRLQGRLAALRTPPSG